MDHIPLPSCPVLPSLKIPYVCPTEYDGGSFRHYPARHAWTINWDSGVFLHDGREASLAEKNGLAQTWLYFGMLHEILADKLNIDDFIETDFTNQKLLTTRNIECVMEAWSLSCIDLASSLGVKKLQDRCTHLLQRLQDGVFFLRIFADISNGSVSALVQLAIAALYEYVGEIIGDILHNHGIEKPVGLKYSYFTQPILDRMAHNGWCPSDIARLNSYEVKVGAMQYYSNLDAPRKSFDHSTCSKDLCEALQIRSEKYELAHVSAGCDCPQICANLEELKSAIDKDQLPLISVEHASQGNLVAKLSTYEEDQVDQFVAISHVWADGLGNPKANALCACSLFQLSTLINRLPHIGRILPMPFWIDTMCIPLGPPALYTKALNQIRRPYENASDVLVLDLYLQRIESRRISAIEIFARVICSSWMRRLWTLQEGRLAKRIWFQFADEAVELGEVFTNRYCQEWSIKPSAVCRSFFAAIVMTYQVGYIDGWQAEAITKVVGGGFSTISFVRLALSIRSVSVLTDEALCLFCLLGLDMRLITGVPPCARMKTFWHSVPNVPRALIFSKAPQKIECPGLRWAPTTFLGMLPRNHWGGPPDTDDDRGGVPTNRGLVVEFPGLVFTPHLLRSDDPIVNGFFFEDLNENWHVSYFDEPWRKGAVISDLEGEKPLVIILFEALNDNADFGATGPYKSRYVQGGIVGELREQQKGVNMVIPQMHVSIFRLGPGKQHFFRAAMKCSKRLRARILQPAELLSDPEDLVVQNHIDREFHADSSLVEECKEYGRQYDTDGLHAFFLRVKHFCKWGDRFLVRETVKHQKWCVD